VYEKPKSKEKGLSFEILIKKILKVYNFRYIIVHAGNSDSFIEGAELIFSSSTKNSDYHGEMNKHIFFLWFQNQLLPSLKAPSVIIMDNASYHCDTENKSPTSNSKKAEIQNWLRERNIAFEPKSLKPQLLEKVKPPKSYIVDNLVLQAGHRVIIIIIIIIINFMLNRKIPIKEHV
jgi:hypothetical protein